MIKIYGADAVRLFILSDSPPEKDIQWSENGMAASFKFIQKFWSLGELITKLTKLNKSKKNLEIEIFTNQVIDKINSSLEKFRYNVIIAVFHEVYSFFKKISDHNENYENLEINFKKILMLMNPVIPHLTSECLLSFSKKTDFKWPELQNEYLKSEEKTIVI